MSKEQSITERDDISTSPDAAPVERRRIGPFTVRRWLVIAFFTALVLLMMQTVLDPYGDKGYMEISHGDHTHYLPPDRDPDVSVSNFPTSPPGSNERITPDGRIVPK